MKEVKTIRLTDKAHKWLTMQRAITGIPANRQIEILIDEKIEKETKDGEAEETAVLRVLPK